MYNVVKQIKRSFAVFTAVIITVTTRVRAFNFRTCGPEELAQCAKTLSVLTDTGLSFVKNKEDLDMVCPDLNNSLSCIHAYSRLCMNLQQRKHFRKLFHGTGSMVRELCRNGTYQDEFLFHAPCLQKVADETEVCFKKYSEVMTQIQTATNKQKEQEEAAIRNYHHYQHRHHYNKSEYDNIYKYQKAKREAANEGLKSVCCAFQEYVDCSTHSVRATCGDDAALFSRGFLDKMASSMIKMHCMDYGVEDCRQKGYNVRGYYEGYYSNSLRTVPYTAVLSLLAMVALLVR